MTNTDTRPDIYDRALAFANLHHANDFRKDGKTPYMVHVLAVDSITERIVKSEGVAPAPYPQRRAIKAVAVLHDVMEDHRELTRRDLVTALLDPGESLLTDIEIAEENAIVLNVVTAVLAITKKPKGEESYDSYVRRVANNAWARIVKRADLEHNLSDLGPGSMRDKYELTKWVLENVKVTP